MCKCELVGLNGSWYHYFFISERAEGKPIGDVLTDRDVKMKK
jgi:hypothetical protein